jgi:hypothetical protein
MKLKFLLVEVNPFTALDENGFACGTCPTDPQHEIAGKVGARIVRTFERHPTPQDPYPPYERRVEYLPGPHRVPWSQYYVARLRDGELFPADPATARAAGVQFRSVADALASAKTKAVAEYRAVYQTDPACLEETA